MERSAREARALNSRAMSTRIGDDKSRILELIYDNSATTASELGVDLMILQSNIDVLLSELEHDALIEQAGNFEGDEPEYALTDLGRDVLASHKDINV
jgi:DNA-binding MarR family transcriptional regulator